MKDFISNGKEYLIENVTGKVAETSKNLETKISGGGGGGGSYGGTGYTAPVTISSRTVVHDQIFLIDNAGNEHSYQLSEMNIACREGNELTITSATLRKNNSLIYLAATNNTTQKVYFNVASVNKLFWPSNQLLYIFMGIGAVLAFINGAGFFSIIIGPVIGLVCLYPYAKWVSKKGGKQFMASFRSEDYD